MKTLLILHGWQDAKEPWEPVKKEIEKSGINVIIPDLPGFKKENSIEKPWDLNDYVEWVKKFVEKNINKQFFLAGYSFGGRVSIKFANKYPERICGLILISGAGITPRPKIKIKVFWLFSKIGDMIFSLPILNSFKPLLRKVVYFIAGTRDYRKIESPFMKQTFRSVIGENLTNLLSKISMPTLILWGDKDVVTPISDAYIMRKQIPNSELEILKGFKHCSYVKNPELTSQKITDFINKN
ncbi:MAG: alpha/beta hydrolase [Candidatus Pacebacteria bacterium]|nr:alpha/beta hydrolase [Candidatus Paceibacterota bacterium]